MAFDLRPYQLAALDNLRISLAGGNRCVMLYGPTGSGKTVTAEAMIRGAIAKRRRVAFIANRKQLVGQVSDHLARAGIAHGILQADNTRGLGAPVLVCSIDTIHARGFPDDVGLIVIDEAHSVAGSRKYRALLDKYNRVPVIGLSATPFAPGLGQVFSDMVIAASIRELIDDGYLVDLDVYAPADPDVTGVRTQRGISGEMDFSESQLAEAVDKPQLVGDIVQHWLQLAGRRQTVAFCTNIPHSQHVVDEFRKHGITAEHLDYHASEDTRADILGRFARGEFPVLSNVGLLAEGWDCPAIQCMILARPTKSLTRFIQMVGRVLRPAPGKTRALLLDHSGTTVRLGFPTDDLPLELDDGRANRSGTRKQERQKSEPKPCPACKYVRPAGVHACPKCGFAPQRQSGVEVQDGELVKLSRKRVAKSRFEKVAAYGGLLWIAQERGYSRGWVAHKYRELFGVWPRSMPEIPREPSAELRAWVTSRMIRYAKASEKAPRADRAADGPAPLAALADSLSGVDHG